MAKRAFDLFFSFVGLLVASPLLLALAVVVKMSDGGPVIFRQERVGQAGKSFLILKFRSMVANAQLLGPAVTQDGDPRVTRVGRFLRKSKLDELPQLWNVLRGEMSFVGPRPEAPTYVAKYTVEQRKVLALQPGITDLATLEFRNEEELLRAALEAAGERGPASSEGGMVEKFYIDYCVPRKIELNLAYAQRANIWEDAKLIVRTIWLLGASRNALTVSHGGALKQAARPAAPGQ